MKFLKTLDLKKSYFKNGWAYFDQVSYSQILELISLGCSYSDSNERNQLTINIIKTYDELMTFGEISDTGYMYFYGVVGFPFDSKCVEYCKDISKNAEISKINHHSIYIEW